MLQPSLELSVSIYHRRSSTCQSASGSQPLLMYTVCGRAGFVMYVTEISGYCRVILSSQATVAS